MSRLIVAPIVEGHGEEAAIRTLLVRIWTELVHGEYIEVLRPIRAKRNKMVKDSKLDRLIGLAALKLQAVESADPRLVLVLLDADKDCAAQLGPRMLTAGRASHGHLDVTCVLATVEYETWFVAAAESLAKHLQLREGEPPTDPESMRAGKGWIVSHWIAGSYSETIEQPALTAQMDLNVCRARSPSFDKLCRELEKRRSP